MSNLEGVTFWGDYSLESMITLNLINFMSYGFLELGSFINITKGQTNYQGIDQSQLTPAVIPGVPNYKVYNTARDNLIWETNVLLKYSGGSQPTVPTGIFINGTGYPDGSGFIIDFSRGRVIFDNHRSPNDNIQMAHSLRGAFVYDIEGYEFGKLNELWRNLSSDNPSGSFDARYQRYLPAIFINILGYKTIKGLELGSRGKLAEANIEFTVVATSPSERQRLSDICYMLEDKAFRLFNPSGNLAPLNYRGQLIHQQYDWKYLTTNYSMGFGRFKENAKMLKIDNIILPILMSKIRIGVELEVYPV